MSMVFRDSSNGDFRVHTLTFPGCFVNFSDLANHHPVEGPGGFHVVPRPSPNAFTQAQPYSLYSMNAHDISKVSPYIPSECRPAHADHIQSHADHIQSQADLDPISYGSCPVAHRPFPIASGPDPVTCDLWYGFVVHGPTAP